MTRVNPPSSGDRSVDIGRAAVAVAASVGYEDMTVVDIAATAGIVRRTFARYYAGKDAAFEAGYREISDALRATVQAAYDAESTPSARTHACLTALAGFLAADPARADALLIHGHAAGAGTVAVHCETMRRLVDLILLNTAGLPQPPGDPRVVAETVAGGIYEVAYARAVRGQIRDLPGLVPEWTRVAMAPYVALARDTRGDRATERAPAEALADDEPFG